jgi:hypothetical protein
MTRRKSAIHEVLGDAFDILPLEVQRTHDHDGHIRLSGHADVRRDPGIVKALVCWMAGLPQSGSGQRVTVDFFYDEQGNEHWRRNFSGRVYSSIMRAGDGRFAGKLVERLSVWTGLFDLEALPDRLRWTMTGFGMFGIMLPWALRLRCEAFECGYNGKFRFDITMELPYFGRLITYRGEIAPASRTLLTPEEHAARGKTI